MKIYQLHKKILAIQKTENISYDDAKKMFRELNPKPVKKTAPKKMAPEKLIEKSVPVKKIVPVKKMAPEKLVPKKVSKK